MPAARRAMPTSYRMEIINIIFVINVWVLEKIGTDLTIRRGIMERKLNYLGHIVRRSEGIEKQILQGAVEGKRGRGRPPISWTDDIKKVSGQGMKGATQMAGERVACSREGHSSALQRYLKLMMMMMRLDKIVKG